MKLKLVKALELLQEFNPVHLHSWHNPKIIPKYHFNAGPYQRITFLSEKVVTSPPPPPPSWGRTNTVQRGMNKAEKWLCVAHNSA